MPKFDPAKIKKVSFSLPFGIGSVEWEADPTERRAAWSLYIELVTRTNPNCKLLNKKLKMN
ncbi:MAG: hypothetical protein ICV54_15745 [Nostoc sp. C3-bin3]|nr:hypothetical protein [Nostoc sp. C3-bin3]